MTERTVISSINQFANMVSLAPGLLNIGGFSLLKEAIKPTEKKQGCNCKGGGVNLTMYRPQFEAALAMLSDGEKQSMKSMLNTKQLCYYTKNTQGQLKLSCF